MVLTPRATVVFLKLGTQINLGGRGGGWPFVRAYSTLGCRPIRVVKEHWLLPVLLTCKVFLCPQTAQPCALRSLRKQFMIISLTDLSKARPRQANTFCTLSFNELTIWFGWSSCINHVLFYVSLLTMEWVTCSDSSTLCKNLLQCLQKKGQWIPSTKSTTQLCIYCRVVSFLPDAGTLCVRHQESGGRRSNAYRHIRIVLRSTKKWPVYLNLQCSKCTMQPKSHFISYLMLLGNTKIANKSAAVGISNM